MKEEQLLMASIIAGLIARMLCTGLSVEESQLLQAWTKESPDNQQLIDDLSDPEVMNLQIIDFNKFNKTERLEKLRKRLPGA
jgi:hypothetical protein